MATSSSIPTSSSNISTSSPAAQAGPGLGPSRWKVKTDHSLIQGMLDSMLLCRYEKNGAAGRLQWQAWSDDHWNRAWKGMAQFEKQAGHAVAAVRHRADRPRLRARLCRFPLCRLRLAQGLSEARRLPSEDAGAAVGENLGPAAGVTTMETAACARAAKIAAPRLHCRILARHGSANESAGPEEVRLRNADDTRRWLDLGYSRKRRPRWRAALRHRGAAEGDRSQRSRRGHRPPWQAGVRAIFAGPDERWEVAGQLDFDATTRHDMRSASKSVISLLVGIAIDRKLIASADEPVVKFFPEYAALNRRAGTRSRCAISSRCRRASSGTKRGWNDPKNDEPHLGCEPDPIRYILSKPIVEPPDTLWAYNGGGTDLLGNLLERVSGSRCRRSPAKHCSQPLGITDFEWKVSQERGRSRRGRASASARAMPQKSTNLLNPGAWKGSRLSRRNGSSNRFGRAFRRSAISAGCSFTASNGGWGVDVGGRKSSGLPRRARAASVFSSYPTATSW